MIMKRVLVGMSGGIDSFVTALLLQQQGYEVQGVVLELWKKNDIAVVEEICQSLQIPLMYLEERKLFREKVVHPFIEAYLSGYTPSPCCFCNNQVKWEILYRIAQQYQIPFIATGHYVRIKQVLGKYYIQSGIDPTKDQSYFLYGLPQKILSKALTPLGDYTKAEVRNWALNHGFKQMVCRRESMGICFLEGKDYREFIRETLGEKIEERPGWILDRAGRILGEHRGLLNYTIGQKRDIPNRGGEPLYVSEMDVQRNVIIADVKSSLYTSILYLKEATWVSESDLLAKDITVKVRGLGINPQGFVRVEQLPKRHLKIELSEPAWAIAPGQPVAFFRRDLLVGGGIAIKRCEME